MNHSFNVDLAIKYGVQASVLLENIKFWIAKNKSNRKHFHDGRWWTYCSAKAYAELFPYYSEDSIQRSLKELEKKGALVTGNYNSNPYDRTKWYALGDDLPFVVLESRNVSRENAESTNTYINTDNTVTKEDASFDTFWNAYPRKTNKGFARKVFNKLKPSEELLNKMLAALEQHKAGWTDPKYIPHPSTWLNGERWEDEVEQPMSAYQRMMRS